MPRAEESDDRINELLGEAVEQRLAQRSGNGVGAPVETPSEEPSARDEPAEVSSVQPLALLGGGSATDAISSQQISLPKGEGSITGMGESFSPNLSSGTGTFSIPIAVPAGRAGLQPSLTLSYATTGGSGVAGIGWNVGVTSITRQTDKAIPRYVDRSAWHVEEDTFMYNGGQELVPVSSSVAASIDSGPVPAEFAGWQQYRSRVEGAFMRFFRSPDSKRWVVQGKDGMRFDFGACPSSEASSCEAANLADPEDQTKIFSWPLVRQSDVHGSTIQYRYTQDSGTLHPLGIYYTTPARCASVSPATARACSVSLSEYAFRIGFVYESRQDVTSSYTTTWRTESRKRLKRIEISSAQGTVGTRTMLRRYHLSYDPYSYHSLLTSVQLEGRRSTPDSSYGFMVGAADVLEGSLGDRIVGDLQPAMRFTYSEPNADGGQVPGFGGIDSTVLRSAASPSHSVDEGRVEFFDVNSDGLTDVLVTDPARYDGGAGVFFNGFSGTVPSVAGSFSKPVRVAIPGGLSSTLNLASLNIVPMDVDGDGRGDLLHMPRAANYGYFVLSKEPMPSGRAYEPLEGWSFAHVGNLLPDGVTDPRIDLGKDGIAIKTLDLNNDRLIDIVRTTGQSIQTWLNLGRYEGGEGRFGSATVTANGVDFSTQPVETCLPYAGGNLDFSDSSVRIADMNGDGLVDIVKLSSNNVAYWPGRGEGAFGDGTHACNDSNRASRHIQMADPPVELNPELAGLELADVNQDGATDLLLVNYDSLSVWFNRGGAGFSERLTLQNTPFAPAELSRIRITDIDGSTTDDLVYADAGNYRWIDFMGGVKPRLLVGIENGYGGITTLSYASSAEDYLRDLRGAQSCDGSSLDCFTWHREPLLPNAGQAGCDAQVMAHSGVCVHRVAGSPVLSSVVRSNTTTDRLNVLGAEVNVTTVNYFYHDGYYEGIEQEFRGFGAADAVKVGDQYSPTTITRTHFHQGRRPNEIASDRLADNPNEALKGREYLTELSDETGRYVSSSHSTIAVRRLIPGLNGTAVSYAYVKATDELRYDTSAATVVGVPVSLVGVVREEAREGSGLTGVFAGVVAPGDSNHSVTPRTTLYARIRSTTDSVDNAGNVISKTAWGRNGVGEFGEAVGDERIRTVSAPQLLPDTACGNTGWLWRSSADYVTGADSVQLKRVEPTFNACGDITATRQVADLPSVGAMNFAGDGTALSLTQSNDAEFASTTVDSWGQPTVLCEGGLLASQGANPCLRYKVFGYDADYQDTVVTETSAIDGAPGSYRYVSQQGVWDRGLRTLVSVFDYNGYKTDLKYDGLGRVTAVFSPPVLACEGTTVPTSRTDYAVTSDPVNQPLSRVTTTRYLSCSNPSNPDNQQVSHTYFDGTLRTRVKLQEGDPDSQAWDDGNGHAYTSSGREIFSAKGAARTSFQPSYFGGSPDDYRAVMALPQVPFKSVWFDSFERQTLVRNEDGQSYRSMSYHALSSDTCDEGDNGFSQNPQHAGTCTTTRTDGHGRVIDQQRRQVTLSGTSENHRLFSYFRADGLTTRVVRASTAGNTLRPEGALTGSYVERRFHYDSLGRRIASEDPDTDNRADASLATRTWRYLYNRVGALVAVRDPRGCGQNFYYDLAGRLIGEAFVGCAEAQLGELASTQAGTQVPAGSISLTNTASAINVHTRYYFDFYPAFGTAVVPTSSYRGVLGRTVGIDDRGQRRFFAYDQRGDRAWQGTQVAVIADAAILPTSPSLASDGRPKNDGTDETPPAAASVVYDTATTYTTTTKYDHAGRPYESTLPIGSTFGESSMPSLGGRLSYYQSGAPKRADLLIAQVPSPIILRNSYTRDGLTSSTVYGDGVLAGKTATVSSYTFDARRRPTTITTSRTRAASRTPGTLGYVSVVQDQHLTWDGVNLVAVQDFRLPAEWPAGHKPFSQQIAYDALYRVAQVAYTYQGTGGLDAATDWRTEETRRRTADPMQPRAAPMVPTQSSNRVMDLDYGHDWLANQTDWRDDAHMFYERSLGALVNGNNISSGTSPSQRPSALYLARNLDPTTPADLGGWLETDYGRGGNLLSFTVHARCTHVSAASCADPGGTDIAARRTALRSGCRCNMEQHFVYRWDALNRLQEARRYDRVSQGAWSYAARQRYRYDAQNQRVVKHTLAVGGSSERAALYVFPGHFERRGLVRAADGLSWTPTAGAESEYLVAGARVVWKVPGSAALYDPSHRITYALKDLLGSTTSVLDLASGELVEAGNFYPSGAREEMLGADNQVNGQNVAMEPAGFTGKEADEEVGLTYFGERYLIARIGRWASPDPLSVHAAGGGETGNAYHYVSGNLLQARDPLGLEGEGGVWTFDSPEDVTGDQWTKATGKIKEAGYGDIVVKMGEGKVDVWSWNASLENADGTRGGLVFNADASANWRADASPFTDRKVAAGYHAANNALALVATGAGLGLGGAEAVSLLKTGAEGAAIGGGISAAGTALGGGTLKETVSAGVGGAVSGGMSAMTGGPLVVQVAANITYAGLGGQIENTLNSVHHDPAFEEKAIFGGVFSGIVGTYAPKLESAASGLAKVGLTVVKKLGGALMEITDPLMDEYFKDEAPSTEAAPAE